MKINDRFGVLVVKNIIGDVCHVTCLAHPNNAPIKLTAGQLSTATRCFSCAADSGYEKHTDLTGQTFGEYVAIKCVGLSKRAATVKQNQKQWRGMVKLDHSTYCRHKYWKVYNVKCHHEIELRSDVLRAGKTPKRCPICRK